MIRGYFAPGIMPQPLLPIALHIEGFSPEWAVVPFVIDTGAALTCIHAVDAIRFFGVAPEALEVASWESAVQIGGVGGSFRYLERAARFGFRHEDGRVEIVEATVRIGELRSEGIPALLGWDLLKHFDLEIDANPPAIRLYSAGERQPPA